MAADYELETDTVPRRVRSAHLALFSAALVSCMPPGWGAAALLHPGRLPLTKFPALTHEDVSFTADDGVVLKGWLFRASAPRRGLLVCLHGIGNNRSACIGTAERFVPLGWDVLAYDARAHGESGGAFCSYGVLERRDLSRALDAVKADRALLFGSSLGASVALQAAAVDSRVRGVIAQSPFKDLRSIAEERAPFIASRSQIAQAFALAEQEAHFRIDDASPLLAARSIQVPVLLIHGDADRETRPEHSLALYSALQGQKSLVLVPGASHNDVLAGPEIWKAIETWMAARNW
jgi:pimeloyl-ACP methyl ester carboxylesterase